MYLGEKLSCWSKQRLICSKASAKRSFLHENITEFPSVMLEYNVIPGIMYFHFDCSSSLIPALEMKPEAKRNKSWM